MLTYRKGKNVENIKKRKRGKRLSRGERHEEVRRKNKDEKRTRARWMTKKINIKGKKSKVASVINQLRRMGSGGIAPISFTSALGGGEWSASRSGHFIHRGKSPRYPLDKRLGGPQNRSE
jgi:hypothetical protein